MVVGWSIDYIGKAALNSFQGFSGEDSQASFQSLLDSPLRILIMHTLFIVAVVLVVGRGVQKGIEKLSKFMMPMLFLLLLLMVVNAIFNGDIKSGLHFLFTPDFSKLTPAVIAMALGQAFFSIAVGVGVLMTYGSYMPKNFSVPVSATIIVLSDTLVALLAGIAIFPMVFQYGLNLAGGPGLIFVTLPIALIALFAGWAMLPSSTAEELALQRKWLYRYWQFSIRYVAPVAICLIFITSLS